MNDQVEAYKMTDDDWNRAHHIASELVQKGVDVNELAKVFTYLRTRLAKPDALNDFWLFLNRLPRARAFVRSGRTLDYYKDIQNLCGQSLKDVKDASQLTVTLGWAVRLARFYKEKSNPPTDKHTASRKR